MADSDSFVQEVNEEVRRDAMFAAWKKYGPWIIGLIFLIVVGTAAREWWQGNQVDKMREQGGAYLAAQSMDDGLDAAEAFQGLAGESQGNFSALAGLRAGADFGGAGEVSRALEEYEAVAAMDGIDSRLSSLAELRIVMIQADTLDPDEMLDKLQPLTEIGAPWRVPALEFEAAAHLRKGDKDQAIATLQTLLKADNAPPDAISRATEMIAALGGSPDVKEPTTEEVAGDAEK